MNVIALIPAYNPELGLVEYVQGLLANQFADVVIVNDGSRAECQSIFTQLKQLPGVSVIDHAVNLGKGAALKTGFNFIAYQYPSSIGVVTMDADGQHALADVIAVREQMLLQPQRLIVGCRGFGKMTPFRSKLGNNFTKYLFRLLTGVSLRDTQSGLRGIPLSLIPKLLRIAANGYEFELDMLVLAHRNGLKIIEQPIETIYIDGNKSSHFRPLQDSLRIYFVLFRFTLIAILSAAIDYAIFIALYYLVWNNIITCLVAGRLVSTVFNYVNVKRYAFHFKGTHSHSLPQYVMLACISLILSYAMISGLLSLFNMQVITAKLLSEFLMFIVNFLVQRDFIFRTREA